jgi:hypothetical protein
MTALREISIFRDKINAPLDFVGGVNVARDFTALSLEVMNFLKTWLLKHIRGSDKACGPHLNSMGIR